MADVADLLLLQQKLRHCTTISQLGRTVVNQTSKIATFNTAVLWLNHNTASPETGNLGSIIGGGAVQAVSGLAEPAQGVPFTNWVKTISKEASLLKLNKPEQLNPDKFSKEVNEQWSEFFPSNAVWVPLNIHKNRIGALLIGRDEPWKEEELSVLNYWAGAVAHAIYCLLNTNKSDRLSFLKKLNKKVFLAIGAVLLVLAFVPVSLTVNSQAEVVPLDAEIVRSPIDGIIGEIHVEPNQQVQQGDLIISFDDTSLNAERDVVAQELAIAEAEYQRANQAAVSDRQVASELPMLQAIVEQREAQVRYTQSLLERSRIFALKDGIVVIPKVSELEGLPVQIGEKLFTLAEPGRVEIEFWLAVGDSIPLPDNAEVSLFLNVYPDQVHHAEVVYTTYQAEVSPDGILGYRGRARFTEDTDLRIGWRGTAKIYGDKVPLIYFLFRRPLSTLRQWTGL